MSNQEREGSIRPPIFDGSNFVYWKVRTTTYIQSLGIDVWEIVEGGYTFPSTIPRDKQVKNNVKPMLRLSIHYWEVYHNQSLSRLCSSNQPKKYGTKSF